MTPADLAAELRRLSESLDATLTFLRDQVRTLAQAEHDYRQARAEAWVRVNRDSTAREREDEVNAATAGARRDRDLADGLRQAALEAVRAKRTQISALQTVANAFKAEADLARTGPGVTP